MMGNRCKGTVQLLTMKRLIQQMLGGWGKLACCQRTFYPPFLHGSHGQASNNLRFRVLLLCKSYAESACFGSHGMSPFNGTGYCWQCIQSKLHWAHTSHKQTYNTINCCGVHKSLYGYTIACTVVCGTHALLGIYM